VNVVGPALLATTLRTSGLTAMQASVRPGRLKSKVSSSLIDKAVSAIAPRLNQGMS